MSGVGEGWQVLEIGSGSAAASFTGMLLADAGFRVVKLEPPGGDRLRQSLPSGFAVWNRGKESLVADLRTEEGRLSARKAALRADVVVAGAPLDSLTRWGLRDEDLRHANPALVHCAITGFGLVGPYSALRAYEGVVAAKAGVFARGDFGFRPGPIFFNAPWGSIGAAHEATAGILAALLVRERTGRGQKLEATMVQGISALDYFGAMHWQYAVRSGGDPQVSIGSGGAMAATRTMLWHATADGRFLTTTPQLPHQAKALTVTAGLGSLIDDPRFANMPFFPTAEDAQAWEDHLWEAFRARSLAEWMPLLEANADIAFEVARTCSEALDHPQMLHNGESVTITDERLGVARMVGPVAAFSRSPMQPGSLDPALGVNAGPIDGPAPLAGGGDTPAHPLAGVTIIDCGYFYAMPFGLTLAASLGARVIKIEGLDGDPFRVAFGVADSASARVMEGKESIAIDLGNPASREVMHRIVADADVFVTSFRPGVPARLGLDYETLRAVKPDLVYVAATGYGLDGPYAHRAMYATAASTGVGAAARHSGRWLDPGLTEGWGTMELQAIIKPRLTAPVDGDSNAALAVLTSVLLGLTHQRRTGEGQLIASSMLGGNALMYSDDFCNWEGRPAIPVPDDESFGLDALYRLYQVADGWVFLAAPSEREWTDLVKALDLADLAADGRFATAEARRSNDGALAAALGVALSGLSATDLESRLSEARVGCAAVFEGGNAAFTSTDPALRSTGLTVEVDHPLFGPIVRHGLPVSFSETPGRIAPSCLLGEHTEDILVTAGYSPTEIAGLVSAGVVATRSSLASPTEGNTDA